MTPFRVIGLLLATMVAPRGFSAQDQPIDPQVGIRIDVVGAPFDDTAAALKKKKSDWIELRTRNFIVAGDADLSDIRQAASEAELFRSQFERLFPRAKEPSSVPTRIIVFRDRQSIRQFGPMVEDASGSESPYFTPDLDINYLVLAAGDKLSREIIRKLVPLLARDSISPVPLWFQEGLSEYFSTYELERLGNDRVVKIGLDEYKQKLKEKELIPLPVLFNLSRDDFESMDPETRQFFSAESCALFDYLLATKRLAATLKMINGMAEGKLAAASFRESFKLSLPTFEENFRRQIQFSKLMGWIVGFSGFSLDRQRKAIQVFYAKSSVARIPANFDTVRADVESRPVQLLTEAQAGAYRGDLLFHNGRLKDAERELQAAVALDGRLAPAFASLGAVDAEQHQYAAAQQYIDKALHLNSSNYLAYYYDAALIRQEARESNAEMADPDLEEVRAALTQSVGLAPGFVQTSQMLAETQRLLHGDLNLSLQLLVEGLRRSPGRESLLMEMAKVSTERGQRSTAGWMLQRLIFSGSVESGMKKEARDLLDRLHLTPDEMAEFGTFAVSEAADSAEPGQSIRLTSKKDRKALAKSEDRGDSVRGLLTNVDCSNGMTLYIMLGTPPLPQRDQKMASDQRIENLHTATPEQIDWSADNGESPRAIACGKIADPFLPVVITYKPGRKGLMMGEPLVVEFLYLGINVATIRSGIR